MDPNENLNEQLRIAKRILDHQEAIDQNDPERLAELVLALDEWLGKGGSLPRRYGPWWQDHTRPSPKGDGERQVRT